MFKRYKERHGGLGPIQDAYGLVTEGRGVFGQLGMKHERQLTNDLISELSSQEEFAGLAADFELGRSSLTREQHADFRAGLIQKALNVRVFNAGYDDFVKNSARLRSSVVSDEDSQMLDNFDALARHAQRMAAAGHGDKAQEILGGVLQSFTQYAAKNEEQRLQLESMRDAGRDKIRDEIQTEVNQRVLAPMIEDEANYRSILAQLEGGDGAAAAPNALTSAVLEYAGAQLRGSDDGNWSFSLGPLGLGDAAVPTMTYSQLRNQLGAAFRGRSQFMQEQLGRYGALAEKRGFGINGTNVDDLLFPAANSALPRKELEFTPKPPSADSIAEKTSAIGNVATDLAEKTGIPRVLANAAEWVFGTGVKEDAPPARPRLPVNGDVSNLPGVNRGVYVPPFLRGRR